MNKVTWAAAHCTNYFGERALASVSELPTPTVTAPGS